MFLVSFPDPGSAPPRYFILAFVDPLFRKVGRPIQASHKRENLRCNQQQQQTNVPTTRVTKPTNRHRKQSTTLKSQIKYSPNYLNGNPTLPPSPTTHPPSSPHHKPFPTNTKLPFFPLTPHLHFSSPTPSPNLNQNFVRRADS